MKEFLVAPSILSADFSRLGEEVHRLEQAGADWIHVDVMDGMFVPNLTIGAPVVKAIRPHTKLPLDVHLMIERPERYIKNFIDAGADWLTIHVEATEDAGGTLAAIRAAGVKPGITLRPATPVDAVLPFLEAVDLVLVMTVNPGFGGQSFMDDQVAKIETLREEITARKPDVLIEVDGGINPETAARCRAADVLVAGNYVFKNDFATAIKSLKGAKCG